MSNWCQKQQGVNAWPRSRLRDERTCRTPCGLIGLDGVRLPGAAKTRFCGFGQTAGVDPNVTVGRTQKIGATHTVPLVGKILQYPIWIDRLATCAQPQVNSAVSSCSTRHNDESSRRAFAAVRPPPSPRRSLHRAAGGWPRKEHECQRASKKDGPYQRDREPKDIELHEA
jgi:hypothetical protein